jgi:hypothetical protein
VTTPSERTRAVLHTREFLRWVKSADLTAEVFAQMKREARLLLRHYPSSVDMEIAHLSCPMWFGASLDSRSSMAPDEVERLATDLAADEPGSFENASGRDSPAASEQVAALRLFDVRARAASKGVKPPKR